MKNLLGFLCAVTLVFGMAGVASALTLTSVDRSWSNLDVSGTYNNGVSIIYGNGLEDQVRWGKPAGPGGQSGLGFTGIALPYSIFDIGEAFEIGQLRHFNNPIYAPWATSVDLDISLSFSEPAGLDPVFAFTFNIDETPNDTGDSPADDDYISFPSLYASSVFEISGVNYTLQLLGFGSDASSLVDQFQSREGRTNSTSLWGQITTSSEPVPEPSTILLVGTGLLGIIGFGRKRFNKKA